MPGSSHPAQSCPPASGAVAKPGPSSTSRPSPAPARAVVVGGTGTIGAKLVRLLRAQGREVVVASPSTGVDTVTGEGLADALRGADLVVDASKPRSYEPADLDAFFTGGIRNLLAAERAAGVRHHLSLSIVGSDRAPEVPFYRAKAGMEAIVRAGGVPWTILHATQFFEFAHGIAAAADREGGTALLPPIRVRPLAGDAVAEHLAALVADVLEGGKGGDGADGGGAGSGHPGCDPEIAGPREMRLIDFVSAALASGAPGAGAPGSGAPGSVAPGPAAPPLEESASASYFGGPISADALLPGAGAHLVGPDLEDWLHDAGLAADT